MNDLQELGPLILGRSVQVIFTTGMQARVQLAWIGASI